MSRAEINHDLQNKYARNVKDEILFIHDAESGRKGYFCMGCKNEMQAVISKIMDRESYFRHDPKGVMYAGKCTYSDESYRHKIAKEELQISKRIKVPALYKYDPLGKGQAIQLQDAKHIEAYTVRNEVQFYEDSDGTVKWGNHIGDDKHHIIRADVAFFDSNENPILLIEIVATHKLDQEKLLKLLRLGIDTVSVSIPKDSPEAITESFKTTTRTKWIYNYEQESTEYVQPSDRDSEGVSHLDELQRKLFAESNKCRTAQINNLIRRITRCLESEQFRTAEKYIKSEISRVEDNTEKLRRRLDNDAEKYRRGIEDDDYGAEKDFRVAKNRNQNEILELEGSKAELEGRYSKKADEIDGEARLLDYGIDEIIRKNGGDGTSFESRKTANIREHGQIEHAIRETEERIETIINTRPDIEQKYDHLRNELIEKYNRVEDEEKRNISKEYQNGNDIPNRHRRSREGINRLKEAEEIDLRGEQEFGAALPGKFKVKERKLREEFDELRRSTVDGIAGRTYSRNPQLSEGYERVISEFGTVTTITQKQRSNARSRAIKQFLESGEYKIWIQ